MTSNILFKTKMVDALCFHKTLLICFSLDISFCQLTAKLTFGLYNQWSF